MSSQNRVAKMGSFIAMAGIAGLAVLGSTLAPSADAAITFGNVVDSPGSIILGGLSAMVPKPQSLLDKYLVPGLFNFTQAGLAITKPTQIVVNVNGSLANPMGAVSLPLGVVGAQITLDGMSLLNVTTSDIVIGSGISPFGVNATIDVADGTANPAIAASINNLVTGFFGGVTPNGAPPQLVVTDVTLGGASLGMGPIVVPTQISKIAPTIMKPTNTTVAPKGVPPVFGLGGLYNSAVNLTIPTINKVVVKAVTGAQLVAGVGFSWNSPLNVNLDVPYVSIDLGLNGTRVVTIGIEGLHLAPGPMSAEVLVHLTFNNDPEASLQLGGLVNDFLSGTLNQVVNIGNFTFGTKDNTTATGVILNNLFGGLAINLPLMNVTTTGITQTLLGVLGPVLPLPINIGNLGGASNLLTYLKSLAISTAPGHTLLIEPKIQLPLPFELDLNIPYLSLDINLDNSLLGQLFIANLVGSGSGQVDISVGVGIVFREPAPEIPPTVAKIVTGLTTGSSLDILAGVSNLAIGVSPSDAINTLNYLNFAVPISSVVTGSIGTGDLLKTIMAETTVSVAPTGIDISVGSLAKLSINEAAINILPNNLITAAINLELFLGLPIVAKIGYFGLQASLDGSNLAGIGLTSGLNYGGGVVQMQTDVAISVGTGDEISTKVATLVNAIIAHQSISSSVGISGIVIGDSPSDLITALSDVSVSINLGSLLGGASPSLPSGLLDSIIAKLGLSVSDLSLATIPNAGLQIGAQAKFANPIPVSISVPFIGVSAGLDKLDIVNVGINNIGLVPGPNALQASVNLNFNNAAEAQKKVATFVGEILGGQFGNTPEDFTIHNLRIGASASDYFDILSKIDVSIPSKAILNKANADLLIGKLGLNSTSLIDNALANLKLGAISANLNKAPVIEFGTSLTVSNFSLNAAVNIGYFGIDVALDNHALARIDVPSIIVSTANNQLSLAIKALITVQDTPEVQTDIANLVNFFMSNTTTSPVNNLVLSRPLLGVSTSDNIQTFALLQVPVPLPALLLKAKAYVGQILAGLGGFNMNSIGLSGLVLDLNNPSVIGIQGGVTVQNLTLPADISISYVGASVALDATPLASVTIPLLSLSSANNALSVNFQALIDVNQGQDAAGQVAKLIGSLLYPGQVAPPNNAVIYDPVFGGDKDHLFHILSQVKVNIPLSPILQKVGTVLQGLLANGGNLLAGLDIGSLVIDLNSPQTIGIDAAIAIKNITIPAEIKLNYVGVNVALGTVGLAQIAVPSFTLKPANGALAITAHVDVALLSSDQLTGAITNLISAVMNNQTVPATNVVIGGAVFGGSPTNVFTILQGIAIPVNIAPYINMIPSLIAGQSATILNRVAISGLVLDLNSPQVIGVDASVSIKNVTLPAQIKLNYVGANVAIGEVPLVQFSIPQFTMTPNNGNLDISLHMALALQESTALTQTIGGLVQGVLSGQPLPALPIVISGVAFGGSPANIFTFLQGVKIPINATPFINQALASFNPASLPALLGNVGFTNLVIDLNTPQTIGIDAGILVKNISLPAEIRLNYVGVNVGINDAGLAQIAIPSFSLKPENGGLAINAHIDVALMTSDKLTGAITDLITGVMNNQTTPATNLVISGAVFGGSPTNVFTILQGVIIPVNVAPFINKLPALIASQSALLSRVAISGVVIDLNSPQTIGVQAGISIKNVTLPAQIKLNYVGADVALGQVPLAKFSIPQFTMANNNGNLDLNVNIALALQDSPGLTQTINALVQAILAGQQLPAMPLVISGAAFGASATNVFTFLQGVKIPINISPFINQALATVGQGGISALLGRVAVSDLVVDLNAPQVIGIDASVLVKNVSLPAEIKLNYVGANVALNTIPLAQITVPTFTFGPQGADLLLKVHVNVDLQSSADLSKAISGLIGGLLSNQTLPQTNVIISGATFGASPTNFFTILQGVVVPIDVSTVVAKIGGMLGGAGSLLNGLGLSGLAINLNEAPVIGVDANIAIRNLSLPATLNVGYVGLSIGISGVPLVQVDIPKVQIGSSGADLTIGTHLDVTLSETDPAQTVVAGLVNAVVSGQIPQATIVVSGIAFGPSKSNVYTLLQGVQIPIPISKILSLVPALPAAGTSPTSILNALSLQSADINMKNPPSIGADIAIALLGFQFDAQLLLNYVSISAFLDQTPLATISVPGIKLASGNNQVSLTVNSLVNLASGGEIQGKVAAIAAQVMGNGGSQNVNLVVSKIAFGGSASKVFHILDKVQVSVPLAPYIQQLTGIVGGIVGGGNSTAAPSFSISQLDISAPGAKDLSVAIAASIGGIGSKISVEMPYVGLQVSAAGNGLVYPTINNFQLKNGNVALTLDLPFQPAAPQIIGSLSGPVSQLLFSSVGQVPGSIVVNSVVFGASPSQAFDIASKIGLEIPLNSVFQKAQAYINAHNPLHVNDMNTVLTTTGIQATISVPGIALGSLPLKMNFPIALSGYYKGSQFISIQATSVNLGQSPWTLGAAITTVQPQFSTAINGILPAALQWQNALQDVTMGGVTLGSFTALSSLILTPPPVTLWSPIDIPLDQLRVHLSPLGLDFAAAFVNKGPLQVDVGSIDIIINQGTTQVIEVQNINGPLRINNANQNGGNNLLPLNGALKMSILQIPGFLIGLLNPSNFHFVFSMKTSSGQPMPWLQDALNGVPEAIMSKLIPIIWKVLTNIKFSI